jgi:hypothetical protein
MSIKALQHTRSTGKKHTYDIEMTTNSYEIFLNGKSLKHSGVFAGMFGEITGSDALCIHAVSDIENLTGMAEE